MWFRFVKLGLVFGMLAVAATAHAHPALEGVSSFTYDVEAVDSDAMLVGLSESSLKELLVGQLQVAGVSTKAGDEKPQIFLWVRVIKVAWGSYAATYRLELHDWMTSVRDPLKQVTVTTWQKGGIVSGTKKKVGPLVKDHIRQSLNLLIQDYFDSNPGARPKSSSAQ